MGLGGMTKVVAKEFTTPRAHDKKLIPLLLLAVVLLRITPIDLVLSIIQSPVFKHLVGLNPFALRMAAYGSKPQYTLYCYGMATLLTPYFFYILFNSPAVRAGVASRFDSGGRNALGISAVGCFLFMVFLFYIGEFYSPGSLSRVGYFVFNSKNGIAFMSVGFTVTLIVLFVYFFLYTIEFFRNGDRS